MQRTLHMISKSFILFLNLKESLSPKKQKSKILLFFNWFTIPLLCDAFI